MESTRLKILVVLLMFWLVSCKPDGPGSPSPETAGDRPAETQPALPIIDSTQDLVDGSGDDGNTQEAGLNSKTPDSSSITPTLTHAVVLSPTIIITPLPITSPTLTLTSTLPLTQTQAVSETIVIRSADRLTSTWKISDISVTRSAEINQVAWNQDGGSFAVATSLGVYLYDDVTLETRRSFNVGEGVRAVTFSPNGTLLAFGQFNGDIQWYSPQSGEYLSTFDAHLLGISDLAFPEQSQYLVSGSDDGTVRVWLPSALLVPGTTEYTPTNMWRTTDRVACVDINPFSQLVAAGTFKTLSIWNFGTGEPALTIDDFVGWITDLAFNPGGSSLVVADSSNYLRLWNTSNWVLTHHIQMDEMDRITALDFSPDGKWLAVGGNNGRVLLWDLNSNTIYDPGEMFFYPVTDIAFHPFTGILLSSYKDGTLRFWERQP